MKLTNLNNTVTMTIQSKPEFPAKTFILDFETSGLNPYKVDVIEVAIKVKGTNDSYSALVVMND